MTLHVLLPPYNFNILHFYENHMQQWSNELLYAQCSIIWWPKKFLGCFPSQSLVVPHMWSICTYLLCCKSPRYSWGVVLLCQICRSSWLVWGECSNVKSRFINAADSLSHHHWKHCGSSGKVASSVTVHDSLPFDGTSDHKLAPKLGVAPSMGPAYFSVPMSPSSHHQSSF